MKLMIKTIIFSKDNTQYATILWFAYLIPFDV